MAACPPSCSSHQTTSRRTAHTSDLPLRGAFLKLRVYRHLFQRIALSEVRICFLNKVPF